jgi:hypothetical protein
MSPDLSTTQKGQDQLGKQPWSPLLLGHLPSSPEHLSGSCYGCAPALSPSTLTSPWCELFSSPKPNRCQ